MKYRPLRIHCRTGSFLEDLGMAVIVDVRTEGLEGPDEVRLATWSRETNRHVQVVGTGRWAGT
jgi:hypothetical protein